MSSKKTKEQSASQLVIQKKGNFWGLKAKGKTAILLAIILLGMVAFFQFSQQTTSGNQSPAIKESNGSISYSNGVTK